MSRKKLTPTTKAVDEFVDLYHDGRLDLTPDFQRNSVWPTSAKAYLIDTILNDMPIPLIFLSRQQDTNTGKLTYRVIDGQQRIRSAIAFRQNRLSIPNVYKLKRPSGEDWKRVRFQHLSEDLKERFIGYSFVVIELTGYANTELRDIFVRINKYVVRLNPQEMRDAAEPGAFKDVIDRISGDRVWSDLQLFSTTQFARKRDKEFIAELAILLLEGPQDKKGSIGLYYAASPDQLGDPDELAERVLKNARAIKNIFGGPAPSQLRKLPAFYGLYGALSELVEVDNLSEPALANTSVTEVLRELDQDLSALPEIPDDESLPESDDRQRDLIILKRTMSQQTDNIRPRIQRIAALKRILSKALEGEDV